MTDHLEQYRRLARSIRFVPPVRESELTETKENHSSLASPVSHFPTTKISSPTPVAENFGPPPDPSEHIAALVQKAVSGHTVLPVAYSIQENIGDRISRLIDHTETQQHKPLIILPKIPAPDPNWTPSTPVTHQQTTPVEVAINHIPKTSTNGKSSVEQVASAEIKLQENSSPPVLETQPSEELDVTPLENEDSAIETPTELVEVCTLATKEVPVETPELEQSPEIAVESKIVSPIPISQPVATEVVENINVQETVTKKVKGLETQLPNVSEKGTKSPATTGKKLSPKGWITEVVCPKCGSNKVKEKVEANGQQKYTCKNCGKRWRVDLEKNGGND